MTSKIQYRIEKDGQILKLWNFFFVISTPLYCILILDFHMWLLIALLSSWSVSGQYHKPKFQLWLRYFLNVQSKYFTERSSSWMCWMLQDNRIWSMRYWLGTCRSHPAYLPSVHTNGFMCVLSIRLFTCTCRHPLRPVGVTCSYKLLNVGSGNLPGLQEQQGL